MMTGVRLQGAIADDHKRLPYLQALRAIAATFVVLEHSHDGLIKYHASPPAWTAAFPSLGYFGVATFFIISGFIIFRVEYHSFHSKASLAYLKKRLIRIYPIYWIATLLFIALSPKLHLYTPASVVYSFALFPHYNAFSGRMAPLLGQGWTLQYEIAFYMLFFIALFLPRRLGISFLLTVLAAAAGFGTLLLPFLSVAEPVTLLQYWTRPIILLFGAGILVGLLERSGSVRINNRHPFLTVLIIVACYAVAHQYFLESFMKNHWGHVFSWPFCLACVAACVFAPEIKGRAGFVATRLGDASYSTYLFHVFVLSFLLRLHPLLHWPVLFFLLALVLSNLLGLAVHHLIERPMLRVLRPRPKEAALAVATG